METPPKTEAPRGWKRTAVEIVAPGVAGGWAAGVAVAVVAMLHAAIAGLGLLWPAYRVTDAVFGVGAQGWLSAVSGLAIHLLVAALWGILYAAIVPRGAPYHLAAAMGLVFGTVVFLVMTWLVLPLWGRTLLSSIPNGVLLVYHLLFGALLPLVVPLRRQVSQGTPSPAGPRTSVWPDRRGEP